MRTWMIAPGMALLLAARLTQAAEPVPDPFAPVADGYVAAIAVQLDGKILVGGLFGSIDGIPQPALARLHEDGALDLAFRPAVETGDNWGVETMLLQPDGRLVIGGEIRSVSGTPCTNLARLNLDGTLDATFEIGAGGRVYSLAAEPGGGFIVAGSFRYLGGQPRRYVGRVGADGRLAPAFTYIPQDEVYSVAVQPDGKILISPRLKLVRLLPDGSLDSSFSCGVGSSVAAIALYPDGRILVGGFFTKVNGVDHKHIARLHPDGSLDDSFNPQSEFPPWTFVVQADGKVLLGGSFRTVNDVARSGLARLNPDGSLDESYDAQLNDQVLALAPLPDGKLVVGGTFTSAGGLARGYLARLHGTSPATESLSHDGGMIRWVRGGALTPVGWARFSLLADGPDWIDLGVATWLEGAWTLAANTIPPGATLRAQGYVPAGIMMGTGYTLETMIGPPAITFQPQGTMVEAGATATLTVGTGGAGPVSFQWFKDGLPLQNGGRIAGALSARLTVSGSLASDAGHYSVKVSNAEGTRTSLIVPLGVVDPVIISHSSSQKRDAGEDAVLEVTARGTPPLVYQWLKDGAVLPPATGPILALIHVQGADAGTYEVIVSNAVGVVRSASAVLTVNLAAVDAAFDPAPNAEVTAFAEQVDGRLLFGGPFSSIGPRYQKYVGRFERNGVFEPSFYPSPSGPVHSLTMVSDWGIRVLLGGSFWPFVGATLLLEDGSGDPDFRVKPSADGAFYSSILGSLLLPDGKAIAWGFDESTPSLPRARLLWVGSDGSFETGLDVGPNARIDTLARQADGKFVIGGEFSVIAGRPRANLARLHPDLTLDLNFDPPGGANGAVRALAVQADGKILAAGEFTWLGSQPCERLARLHPDGSPDLGFSVRANDSVHSLALQCDGRILVAGYFTQLGGQPRSYAARLHPDGTLDGTFDPRIERGIVANKGLRLIALQSDGQIILGGKFRGVNGVGRTNLVRLTSTGPASEHFWSTSSTFAWMRGGTGPEFAFTTFAYSDGVIPWQRLGTGVRTVGGWQLTGSSIPQEGLLRVHGIVPGGYGQGSSWTIERVLTLPLAAGLALTWKERQAGAYELAIHANPGQVVVLEFSSDLQSWAPLSTNRVAVAPLIYPDLVLQTEARRFYRVRLE